MKLRYLISLTILLTVLNVNADGTAEHSSSLFPTKMVSAQSFRSDFREQVYSNSSANFFKQDYSLTSLGFLAGHEVADETRIAQLGKTESLWGFHAKSRYILSKNDLVWGEASYTNGKKEDVKWNETSDFDLLYPYVMGDEFGGDMQYEQYYLKGGYAGQVNNWIFGATLGYRARSEYRTKDPRPNNTVADLKAEISAGYNFGKYSLSLGVHAGKYKQTNELKYFNDLGASKEYHLTGLGNEFVRFSGASNNVFYKGYNFGGSINFIPVYGNGISASVMFNQFSFDKVLSDLNKLALNHLIENKIKTEIAWAGRNGATGQYGVKLDAFYARRNGNDNMFGDATNNVFPQIGATRMFENTKTGAILSGFYEQSATRNLMLGISPFAAFNRYKSLHIVSENTFDSDILTAGVFLQGAYIHKVNMFKLSVSAAYRAGIGTNMNIPQENVCHPTLYDTLHNIGRYLDSNETNTKIALRYQIKLSFKGIHFFIEASWSHRFYLNDKNSNYYTVQTGICL